MTLNLSAECWFRPWVRMSYCVKDSPYGFHRTYIDAWDAIALDWTTAYSEYMERGMGER